MKPMLFACKKPSKGWLHGQPAAPPPASLKAGFLRRRTISSQQILAGIKYEIGGKILDRRKFLQSSLEWALTGYLMTGRMAMARAGTLAPYLVTAHTDDGAYQDRRYKTATEATGFLVTMNLATGKISRFPTPIWPHVYDQNPARPNEALGVVKWTESAIVVNLTNGKILKRITAPVGYRFFGHAAFDASGVYAGITASHNITHRGGLCVYETSTWTLQKIAEVGSTNPHEALLTSDNHIAVVGSAYESKRFNRGMRGIVSLMDPSDFKVLRKYPVPAEGHMARLDADHLISGGINPNSQLTLCKLNLKTGEMVDIHSSPDFPRSSFPAEGLSIAVLSPDLVAVTLSQTSQLMLWNISSNRFQLSQFEGETYGVAIANNQLYMNYGDEGFLTAVSAGLDLQQPTTFKTVAQFGNGRHMRLMEF